MNNLVNHNINLGTQKTRAFKRIVQEAIYPKYPESFSPGSMACAVRTFDALKESNGTSDELVDLMLFYVECCTQFTADYGSIDEDFYTEAETAFEQVLKLIKIHADISPIASYKERLSMILKVAEDVDWGYPDQLKDLLGVEFPNFFNIDTQI